MNTALSDLWLAAVDTLRLRRQAMLLDGHLVRLLQGHPYRLSAEKFRAIEECCRYSWTQGDVIAWLLEPQPLWTMPNWRQVFGCESQREWLDHESAGMIAHRLDEALRNAHDAYRHRHPKQFLVGGDYRFPQGFRVIETP
jgi:hypothetical protein